LAVTRCAAALLGVVGLVLFGAASGAATDAFTPAASSVSVAAGGSVTAAESVHLDALPATADVVLAFDTTGSMGTLLGDATTDANAIVSGLQTEFPVAGSLRFAVVDFRDYPGSPFGGAPTDYPYQLDRGFTDSTSVATALSSLALGDGGDLPEAYFGIFKKVAALPWSPGAERILVVLGDQTGHDNHQQNSFADCPNSPTYTAGDPTTDVSLDPDDGTPISAATAVQTLKSANVSLSFVTYATESSPATISACHAELAAPTGGSNVDSGGGTSLAGNIKKLVNDAAAHVGALTVAAATSDGGVPAGGTPDPASWVSFTGVPTTSLTAPLDQGFSAVVAPPADAVPGTYKVDIKVSADGALRTTQQLTIVVKTPISGLSAAVTPSSLGAGIDQVKLGDIPNAWLGFYAGSIVGSPVGSTPVGSTPVGSTPVGSTPVGSTPVGSTPVGSTPVGSTPVGSTPVGSTGLFDMPVGSTPVGSTALSSILLSQVTLIGATWDQILCGTLAGQPLNALTLGDLSSGVCSATESSLDRFRALQLKQVDLSTTLFKSVHWSTLLMANTPLASLEGGFAAWCGPGGEIEANGGTCLGAGPDTTVLQMDVAGQLGSAPVGSTPVGSTPVGSTPVGSTPVGSTAITASKLATIPLSAITPLSGVVPNCTTFTHCADGTLGDAAVANAINPNVTFSDPGMIAGMNAAHITINDIVVAMLGAAGLPWELLPVQGLQPYSLHQSHVTYTVAASVDCSVLQEGFAMKVHLPDGFFPVPGSSSLSLDGGASSNATGDAVVVGRDAASAAKLNTYSWHLDCGDVRAPSAAVLKFDAYVGLRLGTSTTDVNASAGAFSLSANNVAPVTVGQNGEPNDDASSAVTIKPDTLVVGHLAFSGDQDFYQVSLNKSDGTPLPRGTKIAVFLKVPSGSDFDLSVSRPATQSFFSTPVGSTPVGSTPIEDEGVGFSSAGQTLPSETLQDVPVGSTPVGSTPVGSTPVGSTSTTRGDSNEAALIITTGEGGVATIDVTGYNGATSDQAYVLRVQQTAPPPLPQSCPARFPANVPQPASFAPGSLPASLPATTKTLFIVNTQQMRALHGSTDTSTLLAKIGSQSTAGSFAARSEVAGTVLPVDGSSAVRGAYAAWNANPCDLNLRNAVVRAINDVVATYRNSATGLPSLHYIVILGTDEAIPMAASPDPVTLSPEENEAADLAFTTNGLTANNALYSAAAQNNILTDGAYGAFTSVPWLGHDLLLAQLSVSRLVETPLDMVGQINRYLAVNGVSAPTSALVTGYDFLADGAKAVRDSVKPNLGVTPANAFASGHPTINDPATNPLDPPWTDTDVIAGFLGTASPSAIVSLNAHYNHYELQASNHLLATTANGSGGTFAGDILFTMGCHGGLNVADSLGGSGGKYLDWPQLYSTKQAAIYIANTGFGYGDSASVALSERLLSLYAKNLHSDASSVGEEWAATLQQYFATAGAYDVYDEKVLLETTFYGLPFWHFGTAAPATPAYTPVSTVTDAVTGTPSATFSFPSGTALVQSQFGLYRPTLPITSQEVTSSGLPARGLWIKSLSTSDPGATAVTGMPTVDLAAHEPKPAIQPIFFPASPFSLEHSIVFGKERDYANISDQFRPDPNSTTHTGFQRHVSAASFQVFYSNAPDRIPPLISQVTVSAAPSTTIMARVTDDSGNVAEVAALVNDGSWHYVQLVHSTQDPSLWSATTTVVAEPEVFVEATDGQNVGYSANKGSNFTSTSTGGGTGPLILLQAPAGPYGPNQAVSATYQCVSGGSALPDSQCTGTTPNGQQIDTSTFGPHTFVVKALDTNGNVVGSLQRTYVVAYPFKGFFAPVDNQPVINVAKAGSSIPVKFSLSGNQGLDVFFDSSYPRSQTVACDASAPADGIDSTVNAGSSSLSYDAASDRYNYVWKTDSSWAGTCRALILKTKDGVVHRADFKFK
jgi:hypothetical protein